MHGVRLKSRGLWLVILCALGSTAAANEDPRGPQPIRPSELSRYGDVLRLSDEQRFAIEGLYENYLDEYEPLRWEIIETAVRYPRGYMIRGGEEEEFTRRLPAFVTRVRALDDAFFAEVEPLLTQAQRLFLPRVRLMRERSIYANLDAVKRFIGDGVPDFSILLDRINVAPEALDEHRTALLAYEERLTRGLRGVYEAVVRLCGEGEDRAAELLVERVRALRAMNRRMYNDFRAVLPDDAARRLREEFYVHAYGNMLLTARCYIQPECEAALALPDLTPAERDAILQIRQEAIAHQDRVLEELADAMDARAIYVDAFDPRRGDPMAPGLQAHIDLHNATMREMERRHREVSREFVRLLGEEREKAIRRPADFHHRSSRRSVKACGVVADTTRLLRTTDAPRTQPRQFDALIPRPISRDDLEEFVILLDVNDDGREVLLDLHAEYEQELNAYLQGVRHSKIRLWSESLSRLSGPERDAAFDERRRAEQALRSDARQAVNGADARFFDVVREELAIADDDPRLLRLRLLRDRTKLLASSIAQDHPNFAGELDLVALLIRLRLTDAEWASLEEHAEHYETRMMALLRAQFDALYLAYEPRPEENQRHLEVMRRAEAMHDAHAAVAAFNQAMIERFAEVLPPSRSARLLEEFSRRAFPSAFADPASMERVIAQAAALPDLTPAARDGVTEIRNDFLTAYEDVRSRMIGLCAAYEPFLIVEAIMIRSRPKDKEAFAQAFAALSDNRAAINRRALRGLRTTLAPVQLRRLDLPQVE